MIDYKKQRKDKRWKEKSKEIKKRDNFTCQLCGKTKVGLNVHHIKYINGRDYWDYPDELLMTVCVDCHKKIHGLYDYSKKSITKTKAKKQKTKKGHDFKDIEAAMEIHSSVFNININYKLKLILCYLIDSKYKNINNSVKNKLCDILKCELSQLEGLIKSLQRKCFIVGNKINLAFKRSDKHFTLYRYDKQLLPCFSYIMNAYKNFEYINLSYNNLNNISKAMTGAKEWNNEFSLLHKLRLVERLDEDIYRIKIIKTI